MLTQVDIRMATGESLSLPLSYTTNGYVVREIDGLDPGKSSISTGKIAGVRGEQYQASSRDARNIILKLDFEPDYANTTVKSLRDNLYRFLFPESYVTLRFHMLDGKYYDITGMVESFEAPMFTATPGVDVSILCFEPDFKGSTVIDVSHQTSSFPNSVNIDYDGTVKTGIEFTLSVNRAISGFTLVNMHNTDRQVLEFEAALQASDVLRINTVSGSRAVIRTRAGTPASYLYAISPASRWIELRNGRNALSITLAGTAIPFRITATPLYGGL